MSTTTLQCQSGQHSAEHIAALEDLPCLALPCLALPCHPVHPSTTVTTAQPADINKTIITIIQGKAIRALSSSSKTETVHLAGTGGEGMRGSYNRSGHPWGMKIILPYGFFETIH